MFDLPLRILAIAAVTILAVLQSSAPALGDTSYVQGTHGLVGTGGQPGDPGSSGGTGSDGETVVAEAAAGQDAANFATAVGGNGGDGGNGGTALDGPDADTDADGGNGGNGGQGGSATARADALGGTTSAQATARAGYGGASGIGGAGQGNGASGANGISGNGGDASAEASTAPQAVLSFTSVEATASANGGNGGFVANGDQGGDGGQATATATADGQADYFSPVRVDAQATGGSGGFWNSLFAPLNVLPGSGGEATASASANITGTSSVRIKAEAIGGRGGQAKGTRAADGASAHASATGSSEGVLTVTAVQFGGFGGYGVDGDGGNGADSVMINAVSGSSPTSLSLIQTAKGGYGGGSLGGTPGAAGNGRSILILTDVETGRFVGNVGASGGDGGNGSDTTPASQGGTGYAEAYITAASSIDLTVGAVGGRGGNAESAAAANGGAAELGPVFARSTSNESVRVIGRVTGGKGGGSYGSGPAGNGANISLLDAVDGATDSQLELVQIATAGDSGDIYNHFDRATPIAGNAVSSLAKRTSNESLNLIAYSYGGKGGEHDSPSGVASAGGSAHSITNSTNTVGAALAESHALAGRGGDGKGGSSAGSGGNATADSTSSTGPGEVDSRTFSTASGGSGGFMYYAAGTAGNGGDAVANAVSTAASGQGALYASANAGGGSGGGTFASFTENVVAGNGGSGDARATATGELARSAQAFASAGGGSGGWGGDNGSDGIGGDANAVATARLLSGGNSQAVANAGAGGAGDALPKGRNGIAAAESTAQGGGLQTVVSAEGTARGRSGQSDAMALSFGGPFNSVRATSQAVVAGSLDLASRADAVARIEMASDAGIALGLQGAVTGKEAVAIVHALPHADTIRDILAISPDVAAGFAGRPVLAYAEMGGALALGFDRVVEGAASGAWIQSSSIDLSLIVPDSSSSTDLLIGLFDFEAAGSGFDLLQFRILGEGQTLLDESFSDVGTASVFFRDHFMQLSQLAVGSDGLFDVSFLLDVTSSVAGSGFYFNMGVSTSAVPLPPTIAFLLTGMLMLPGWRALAHSSG